MTQPPDEWVTVGQPHRANLKVQRSEFIGIALPCRSEDEFQSQLQGVIREFFDATHHCWAVRLFAGGDERVRSSDAGEPNGTAGRPIASAIEGSSLSDTGVVVVRYYGGVKLGTGGLGRAYRDAAQLVLAEVERVTKYVYADVELEAPFSRVSVIYRMIDPPHVILESEEYGEVNRFRFSVRRGRLESFTQAATLERLSWRCVDRDSDAELL